MPQTLFTARMHGVRPDHVAAAARERDWRCWQEPAQDAVPVIRVVPPKWQDGEPVLECRIRDEACTARIVGNGLRVLVATAIVPAGFVVLGAVITAVTGNLVGLFFVAFGLAFIGLIGLAWRRQGRLVANLRTAWTRAEQLSRLPGAASWRGPEIVDSMCVWDSAAPGAGLRVRRMRIAGAYLQEVKAVAPQLGACVLETFDQRALVVGSAADSALTFERVKHVPGRGLVTEVHPRVRLLVTLDGFDTRAEARVVWFVRDLVDIFLFGLLPLGVAAFAAPEAGAGRNWIELVVRGWCALFGLGALYFVWRRCRAIRRELRLLSDVWARAVADAPGPSPR